MKKLLYSAVAVCALLLIATTGNAQFKNGKDMLGPHIGLSEYGGTITIGGMFEAPITHPNDAGPGIIGIAGIINYYHYTYYLTYGVTWLYFGVFGDYHFLLEDRNLDPFLGVGLYYASVSEDGSGYGYGSGVRVGAHAGLRYFFSPNLAGRVMLGSSASFLTLGIDFGL